MDDVIKIIFSKYGLIGVSLVILGGYFGKIFSDVVNNKAKARNDLELEKVKKNLETTIEQFKLYSSNQFKIYNELWTTLVDLKSIADCLWEKADAKNLFDFRQQLDVTSLAIDKGSLYLGKHYDELRLLINHFKDFQVGKLNLIEYRTQLDLTDNFNQALINDQISKNKSFKIDYGKALDSIRESFSEILRHGVTEK